MQYMNANLRFEPYDMGNYRPADSEDPVRIYTTDTVTDYPRKKVVYKGLILLHDMKRDNLTTLTKEAKKKAKELNANAIIGVKISEGAHGNNASYNFTFIGTAVYVSD